ncbi:MAG: polymorphic toxin type 23 domain-containing protein [Candidatus Woesearchaeota archaeon]
MKNLEEIINKTFLNKFKNKLFISMISLSLSFLPISTSAKTDYSFGISYGTSGFKAGINYSIDSEDVSFGTGLTYHSNLYNTDKSGLELRLSTLLDIYSNNKDKISLGTNKWIGFGELSEFNQQTAIIKGKIKDINFSYEQDGNYFNEIKLSDGCDRYRTAGASISYNDYKVKLNIFTGNRDENSFIKEKKLGHKKDTVISHRKGEFGEEYVNGLVYEKGEKYRYSALTLNHNNTSIGLNSQWIMHYFQNKLAHNLIKKQRQFIMTDPKTYPVFEYSNLNNKFTNW